jgi:hypothetical protein
LRFGLEALTLFAISIHTLLTGTMHEVQQPVDREHLAVDTFFAVHWGSVAWKEVAAMVEAQI